MNIPVGGTGRARFVDAPIHTHKIVPPIAGGETLVGFYPTNHGRRYRMEDTPDGVKIWLTEDPTAGTTDTGAATPAALNARNRQFWAKRCG